MPQEKETFEWTRLGIFQNISSKENLYEKSNLKKIKGKILNVKNKQKIKQESFEKNKIILVLRHASHDLQRNTQTGIKAI